MILAHEASFSTKAQVGEGDDVDTFKNKGFHLNVIVENVEGYRKETVLTAGGGSETKSMEIKEELLDPITQIANHLHLFL